jgi:hypothetical protein
VTGSADKPAAGMGPDDPRISEWIDGRLDPAAADEVQRAVRASPELSLLVEELRSLKAALAGHETAPPAVGFVRDVIAALADAGGSGSAADPAVEAEWRRLEAERIAEERAEACEDAVEPPRPPLPRWGWLAIAGALAAGLVVAVLVNLPRDAGREVAMSEDDPMPTPLAVAPFRDDEADLREDDVAPAAAAPPADLLASRAAAPREAQSAPTDALVRDEVSAPNARGDDDARGKAEKQAASVRALAEARPQVEAAATGKGQAEGRPEAVFKAAAPAAAGRGAGAGNASPSATLAEAVGARAVVIVRVDGARGREALGRLIDTGGLTIVEGEQATADRARERNRAAKTAASQAEWLDVAGTPQAIAALLAALTDATDAAGYGLATGGIGPSLPPTAPQAGVGGDSGSVAGAGLDAVAGPGQTLERLVLVVVERPAPADHTTEPAP